MISFENVSNNPKVVGIITAVVDDLKSSDNDAYLFGSATWRLPINQFDNTHDLDFLIDERDKSRIINLISKQSKLMRIDCKIKKISQIKSYYTIFASQHILVILNNLKIDLIVTTDIKQSIQNICDFDNGMLIYNLKTNNYEIGGMQAYPEIKRDITVEYLLDICASRKIATKYITKYGGKPTAFYRIVKMARYGFTYNVDEIWYLVMNSLKESIYFKNDYPKIISTQTITHANNLFYEQCLKNDAYQLAKQCYYKSVDEKQDYYVETMLQYSLCMKDVEFALQLIKKYKCSTLSTSLKIIMLIRQLNDFNLTIKFIDYMNEHSTDDKYRQSIYQLFERDSTYSKNTEYRAKLIAHFKSL